MNLEEEADSECRTAASDITLKKKDKDIPCLVALHLKIKTGMNRSTLEKKR